LRQKTVEQPVSLSQRAYTVATSFRYLTGRFYVLVYVNLFFIALGWLGIYSRNISFFEFIATLTFFELTIVTFFYLGILLTYGRRTLRELRDWKEDYLQQTYTLVFDTTIPKGKNTAEKILNLARVIFPELTAHYIKSADPVDRLKLKITQGFGKKNESGLQSINYKVASDYHVDLALAIPLDGYFIVKDFKEKTATPEDLQELVKMVSTRFKTRLRRSNIFRVICVARGYDVSLLESESRERLMRRLLEQNVKIDLIVEEKVGYSALWVS
jgi:hypothetical protein